MVDLNAEPVPKCGRQTEAPRAILAAEDDDAPADPVTIACPSRTIQFTNHMILGSQMELYEINELRKRPFREEVGCAFRLQASVSSLILYTATVRFHTSSELLLCLPSVDGHVAVHEVGHHYCRVH